MPSAPECNGEMDGGIVGPEMDTPGGFIKGLLLGDTAADSASGPEDPVLESDIEPFEEGPGSNDVEQVAAEDPILASDVDPCEEGPSPNEGEHPADEEGAAEAATEQADALENGAGPEAALKLSHARRGLKDEDVIQMQWLEDRYAYREVDFSSNQLTETGLEPILSMCARCDNLRVLKLFRNRIGDAGAVLLADLLAQCQTVREVHLSHNRITPEGIEALVGAVQRSRPPGAAPLWLRVENNAVSDPGALLRDLEARLRVCPRRESCTQFRCCIGSKVHLPFLDVSRERQEKEDVRRGLGLRAFGSPVGRLPARRPRAAPGPGAGSHRPHRGCAQGSPSRPPGHDARRARHGHRAEARSATPRARRARSRSRCRRGRRAEGGRPHHARASVKRSRSVHRTRRRAGPSVPCRAAGRSGSRHGRNRTRHRSRARHGHGEGHAALARKPSPLPEDLQGRLNRLLGRC
mmetsp:Transcript_58191/g.160855  ORF Transcript_58191/g.160855 Transcript_58191/m.160855 type:complete len:465 (+) Transcript_58191:122-1516(+)